MYVCMHVYIYVHMHIYRVNPIHTLEFLICLSARNCAGRRMAPSKLGTTRQLRPRREGPAGMTIHTTGATRVIPLGVSVLRLQREGPAEMTIHTARVILLGLPVVAALVGAAWAARAEGAALLMVLGLA